MDPGKFITFEGMTAVISRRKYVASVDALEKAYEKGYIQGANAGYGHGRRYGNKEGYTKGFREGYKKGYEAAREKVLTSPYNLREGPPK